MNFETPTPIQAQTIPHALEGKDVLGTAQTGTGKTAAFGIPLVSHLLNDDDSTALILTPTRELALQVLKALDQMLGRRSGIKSTLLIGGESIVRQFRQLKANPRLIVGTPGRVNDHLERGTLRLDRARFLVLDETDRMLDMGFTIQIQRILKHMPKKRQTLMFSATMAPNIVKMAHSYLHDAVRVTVGSTRAPIAKIKQENIRTTQAEKYSILLKQLENKSGSYIIFVQTKWGTEKLAEKLRQEKLRADAIHGDLRQRQRDRVIKDFRDEKFNILVATDIAARGLDIPHITYVINFDLPQCPEDYIHRIGRTGRAGNEGTAINLITPQEGGKWRDICRLMDPNQKENPNSGRSNNHFNKRRKPAYGGGNRRGGDEGRSAYGANRRGADEGRSAYGAKRRGGDEQGRPAYGANRRGGDEQGRPAYGANRRGGDEQGRSAYGANRRGGDEQGRSAYGANRRGADEGRSAYGAKRRGGDEQGKPAFGAKRRGGDEQGKPKFGARKKRVYANNTR